MKKLGIIVAAIIFLAGGTVAVMTWMGYDVLAMIMGGGSGEGAAEEAEPAEPPRYVDLDPILVPLLQGERMVAAVKVEVKFQAADENAEATLKRILPKISDVYLRDLYGYLPRILREREEIDEALLKDRLMLLAARTSGDPDLVEDLTVKTTLDES